MVHFIGYVRGNRREASRVGSKSSGLRVYAASWQGCVRVELWYDARTGLDIAEVSLQPWQGAGVGQDLFHGPIGGLKK